ncbi:MAG: hypothetical protein ACTS3F_08980 [Phycisphaerales bacterium]
MAAGPEGRAGGRAGSRIAQLPLVLRAPIELLSSVWFGIWLLVILFFYSSIGSAGILYPVMGEDGFRFVHEMPRQWRVFEMTEFEWFHTWFFLINCVLLAANITIVTIRKIPFNLVKLGVWMIHTGIVILTAGALLYFGTKFEGDAPVVRRDIVAGVRGVEGTARLAPSPGDTATLTGADGVWRFSVRQVSPLMPLEPGTGADGGDAGAGGSTAYSAFVLVEGPDGTRFTRRVVKDHPELDEDLIEGRGLVRNMPEFGGARFVDDRVTLTMTPVPQHEFWLKDSHAIYLRSEGERGWQEAPIDSLPRYNDYLPEQNLVWANSAAEELRLDPIDVRVLLTDAAREDAGGVSLRVIGHLRYAVMQERLVEGGEDAAFNPGVDLALREPNGRVTRRQMIALDPMANSVAGGLLEFRWVGSEREYAALLESLATRITIAVPEAGASVEVSPERLGAMVEPEAIPGTEWRFRVREVLRGLSVTPGQPPVSLAVVDFINPEGESFSRWAFEDPSQSLDIPSNPPPGFDPINSPRTLDERVRVFFGSGGAWRTKVIAGPPPIGLRMIDRGNESVIAESTLRVGVAAPLKDGSSLAVERLITRGVMRSRPLIVPERQRDADIDRARSGAMILVEVAFPEGRTQRAWLPYNPYVSDDDIYERVGIASARSAFFDLPSGERLEVRYARQRQEMPSEVRLDDFRLRTHVGGFTGNTLEIRDWHSLVRFRDRDDPGAEWSQVQDISTNDPVSRRRHWYFQSFWDAPQPARAPGEAGRPGFSFTGLGVGNREGVWTMLFGCALSVAGMCYAFYVKPIIKRRREIAVYRRLGGGAEGGAGAGAGQISESAMVALDPSLSEPNVVAPRGSDRSSSTEPK